MNVLCDLDLGPVYMIPVYRVVLVYWDLGLFIIYCCFCSCVYMETETSRLTEIQVKREKLCPYKRNIPVHWDEVKWNWKWRLTRTMLPEKKAKRYNIRWDALYANKISFRFIDKLLSTFPRFFECNRHIPVTRDIPVYRDHIYPGRNTSRATGTSRYTGIIQPGP